jgi:hypothetical protein
MIAVAVCLLVVLALFAAVGVADQRWPDRLSRRGRHLAGLSEKPAKPSVPSKLPSRRVTRSLERRGTKSGLYALAFGTCR